MVSAIKTRHTILLTERVKRKKKRIKKRKKERKLKSEHNLLTTGKKKETGSNNTDERRQVKVKLKIARVYRLHKKETRYEKQ